MVDRIPNLDRIQHTHHSLMVYEHENQRKLADPTSSVILPTILPTVGKLVELLCLFLFHKCCNEEGLRSIDLHTILPLNIRYIVQHPGKICLNVW